MISDDLRLQDLILVYLYEHINKVGSTSQLESNLEDVKFEDINRQLYVLSRKNLVMFSDPSSLSGGLTETICVYITGKGCTRAEKVLQQQETKEKRAQSWSF